MTSMDINAVATNIVRNFLPYENSFAQIQKGFSIILRYSWYYEEEKIHWEQHMQIKNIQPARNTECSTLHLSMCDLIPWDICTIRSKSNALLLKKLMEYNYCGGSSAEDHRKTTWKQKNPITRLRVLSLWTFLWWSHLTTAVFPSLFLKNRRAKIMLNSRFPDWDEQFTMPPFKTTVWLLRFNIPFPTRNLTLKKYSKGNSKEIGLQILVFILNMGQQFNTLFYGGAV